MPGQLTTDQPVGTIINLQDSNQGQVRVMVAAPSAAGLTSFNGRSTPAAVPTAGDYNSLQIADASSAGGPTVFDSLNELQASICAKSGTTTTGAFACAENFQTIASGDHSHAEGQLGESRAINSHCEGRGGLAAGDNSHVEGLANRTGIGASNAHAEGSGTLANAVNSHAEGRGTTANADSAHCEGINGGASGSASHAEGSNCSANGVSAHAEGLATTAQADGSHAEGNACIALGTASHAECFQSIATGNNSCATGCQSNSWQDSDFAHAGGAFVTAGDAQYRRSVLKGNTPGTLPNESVLLTLGLLQAPVTLRASTCYGVTVRATATRMALGAAAREAAYFHLEFLVTVDSAGNVTVSAVTAVLAPILAGAGFVGATLVPSAGIAPVSLALTFTIAALLTVPSRIVAVTEWVEIFGT